MEDQRSEKPSMRFLSFANDKEDAEREAKLKEAAAKIEQGIAREKALSELIDFPAPLNNEEIIDPQHDVRSLYERLQEQKNKKQDVIDEARKLSNFVAHLDEDDADYLNEVAKNRREEELRKRLEVQDALEAKKRLDEQKMVENEKRMRESLLGGSSRQTKTTKSRLSTMIKVKPKSGAKCNTETNSEKDISVLAPNPEISLPSTKRIKSESDDDISHDRKRKPPGETVLNDESSTSHIDGHRSSSQDRVESCRCAKDVAKVLGVLPSSFIVSENPRDSEESDYSDDDLDCRLVPKGRSKRR